ncbi:MAG: hypothetical protein KatS3mg095_0136 [Candidatus Parcubacteria bacterium]|nr:MAG: hypothetical protein KatS3mg095_0136 [Candidatus Parcubacteria bacterium]
MIGLKNLKIFLLFVINFFLYYSTFSQNNCNLDNSISYGYLESPVFDLGDFYNITKISWQGEKEKEHFVGFQIASSITSSGPWIFYGQNSSNNYIETQPYQSYIFENNNPHRNIKYFKYKIFLGSCNEFSSPQIDKIIIYYSK